jgi:O-antigen/teichoic acid export membrane protein
MVVSVFNRKLHGDSKTVALNAAGGLIIKGSSILIGLFTTPAYMRYFSDNAVLGVWYSMLSVLTWIMYFDMGIGNGLRNKLVECISTKNYEKGRRYISSAYIFLVAIALIVGFVLCILNKLIDWNKFFNIDVNNISKQTLALSVVTLLLGILIQLVLRMITSIMYALQKSFVTNLLAVITNGIQLIFVSVCNRTGNNNDLVVLAVVHILTVNIPLLFVTIFVFCTTLKKMRPSFKFFDINLAKETFSLGSKFLVLQILAMLLSTSYITYLINKLISAESVVEYNIYYKIYSQFYTVFGIIMAPIWSAVTKAMVENNNIWIKKVVKTYSGIIALLFTSQFILFPILQFFFDFWLGDKTIPVDYRIMLVFTINTGVLMAYLFLSQLSNGLNELTIQFRTMILAAVLLTVFSIVLSYWFNHFIVVIIAQILALLPYIIIQMLWLRKRLK